MITDHAVHLLVRACTNYDQAFGALGEACRSLDQYYLPTRYPDGLPGGVPHEVYSMPRPGRPPSLAQQVVDLVAKLTNL